MAEKSDPLIVGIGASAGGVEALKAFFSVLPEDTGAAYVVILHLDPDARSELASILAVRTKMPVAQVGETQKLEANHVYVIAPNQRLKIADHTISALPFDEPRGQRAPIDTFFRSLAEQHSDGFAVILTGAGADGAIGVRAIKEAGGIVLVQDPNEAQYASMPRSAIATEVADVVLPVRELAARLVELLAGHVHVRPTALAETEEESLRRILTHVRVRTGHDFSQYKRATVLRRIARRAQVSRKDSLAEYYAFLRDNVEEAQALFSDFLISVTTFFRDPLVFQTLAKSVVPLLFDDKEVDAHIRVWVPGCATGEEAYSVAMLLLEEASRRDVRAEIQVFGSDLDGAALATAREGRYPSTIEGDVTEERLRRFFVREGDHYQVRRELRDVVLFASHSLLGDPPFSRLDMISCRNLLIYLDRELQQQVCSTFHYALVPGGFLVLGSSETADQPAGLFRTLDRDGRIYRSAVASGDKRPALPVLLGSHQMVDRGPAVGRAPASQVSYSDAAVHRQMLERVAPPSMLVDEANRVVHLSDNAGRFLQPSGGPVTTDAIDLVRPEFRFDLRTALHRAFERDEASLSPPIPVRFNGHPVRVFIQVKPVPEDPDRPRNVLVMFIEGEAVEGAEQGALTPATGPAQEIIRQLQEELQLSQAKLRETREESEATNEELRAANEELQSINEEYRSTSEELETSKEELQSINEELQTVNNELKLKLESVSRAHSDLQNFMAATDVAMLFLDPALRIKRFTPRLIELFNVTVADEGRPITDFTHQLEYETLAEDARTVLRDLVPVEHEVKSRGNGWYMVRMRPYRTVDDKIDGVVATFVDITERRRAEDALRESEALLRQETRLVELSRSPIFVWDFDDGIVQWNRGSEELYGYSAEEVLGRNKAQLLHTVVPGSSFDSVREALASRGSWRGELRHTTKDGRELTVESWIELVVLGDRRLVLESTRDVTEAKRWEERRSLLLGELSHRVKNILTVVQSMARQTSRTTPDIEAFIERFEGRLAALSAAHDHLVGSNWEGAEMEALVRSQLITFVAPDDRRISIRGDRMRLPPELATPLGLAVHELASNATKFGALTSDKGRVSLSWSVEQEQGRRRLKMVWRETGGPPVETPSRRGFGSGLIERGIPRARTARIPARRRSMHDRVSAAGDRAE
jgi:two-component system CheB/CheR fusion protein